VRDVKLTIYSDIAIVDLFSDKFNVSSRKTVDVRVRMPSWSAVSVEAAVSHQLHHDGAGLMTTYGDWTTFAFNNDDDDDDDDDDDHDDD